MVLLHLLAVAAFMVSCHYGVLPPPREALDSLCASSTAGAAQMDEGASTETRSPIGLDMLRLVLDSGAPYSIHTNAAHVRNLRPCNES